MISDRESLHHRSAQDFPARPFLFSGSALLPVLIWYDGLFSGMRPGGGGEPAGLLHVGPNEFTCGKYEVSGAKQ
jgi:hypothetical protein